MTYSLASHDASLLQRIEDDIALDDAINEVAADLLALDDLALVNEYKDAMGEASWKDARESLIEDALEKADILSDRDHAIECDRLPTLEDDRLLMTCNRYMSGVRERYPASYCMPERVVTHWDAWRVGLAEEMAETVFKARIEQDEINRYS